tara:strand:+ start:22031 stop:22720 length:690 start_codon:yes stop_codon:yes gene_type:complete
VTDGVICEAEQDRLILTLDRPAKLNAASGAMIRALTEAIRSADATTGMVVIRGNGQRAFCVGSDLEEFQQSPDAQKEHIDALRSLVETVCACPVPVIASVHGFTLGTGAMIAALADIVIASSNLSFGAPEMRHKMYPALIHAVLLERVTNSIAYDLCASARIIGATESLNLGLVSEIVPEDDAARLAERLDFYAENASLLTLGRRVHRAFAGENLPDRIATISKLMNWS